MNDRSVTILFDDNGRTYQPGEVLAGEYRIDRLARQSIKSIEVSVLWYTEGKGDEDMAVHEFSRYSTDEGDWIDPARPARFSTTLPNSPLTYDGLIVKIRWCVRVRVLCHREKDLVGEKTFQLGDVPAATLASDDASGFESEPDS